MASLCVDHIFVAEYYGLLPSGSVISTELLCQCPYHNDTRPSLSLSSGCFHCWSCDASGTLLDLIIHLERQTNEIVLDEWFALVKLSEIKKDKREILNVEMLQTSNCKAIPESQARKYSLAFVSSLGSPAWDRLEEHYMRAQRDFSPVTLSSFDVKINPTSCYPIVIPIRMNGEYKGHVSRIETAGIDPKYRYNSGFSRRSTVGGTLRRGSVMVVEGMLDLMKAAQHGWDNVCCLFGNTISEQQAKHICNYATSVIDGLDNDVAGRKGGELLKQAIPSNVYRLPIPKGRKDIGEMTKQEFELAELNIA